MDILLANPRGFCAGVERAIEIVKQALIKFGAPVYMRHEIVHNPFVVNELREKGAVFVEQLAEVPDHAVVVFSAHGVSDAVRQEAKSRNLTVLDATCPLVTKVHKEVLHASTHDEECILIGHKGHVEVEGTLGQYHSTRGQIYLIGTVQEAEVLSIKDPSHLSYVTQTTLSVDDTARIIEVLRRRFPAIKGPKRDDICYATQNRQEAVRSLAEQADVVLVVGSPTSSNSNRLQEVAALGSQAYLIENAEEIQDEWLIGASSVGITASASAPETLVNQVVAWLQVKGAGAAREMEGKPEDMYFPLPKELRTESLN